jgi:magnesium transporter
MSTKLNDIMRILTVFSVIFIPLTFIVGVYGTNFENLPELHWQHGYYLMWGVMLLTTGSMLWYFKRKKWF